MTIVILGDFAFAAICAAILAVAHVARVAYHAFDYWKMGKTLASAIAEELHLPSGAVRVKCAVDWRRPTAHTAVVRVNGERHQEAHEALKRLYLAMAKRANEKARAAS